MNNKEKAIAIQTSLTEMNALIKARKQLNDESRERMDLAMQYSEDLAGIETLQVSGLSSLRAGAAVELIKTLVYGDNARVPVGTAGNVLNQAADDANGLVWLVDFGKFGRACQTPAASLRRLTPGRY